MDVRGLVDPAYKGAMEEMAKRPADWSDPAAVRASRKVLFPPPPVPDGVEWQDHTAPGPEGAPGVLIRTYRPVNATAALPCIYWIHGGGYMAGTYDGSNNTCGKWALDFQCTVASVEYRLAPEHPYPAPLEDCYVGLQWLIGNAAGLGVDPARVLIAGASAGGGLCAALALLVRDRSELSITHQLLIYPMIDDRRTTESSKWTTYVWTTSSNETGWKSYLGPLPGGDVPAYAAPARATDLKGLPPAFVMVGTLDLFLDEDVAYANRLMHAGVPTELHVYAGGPHGFDSPMFGGNAELGRRARRDVDEWLARALAGPA
jgi:acetyl esterase/lipase